MDATDAFFTHTIVGAPLTVLLGRRQTTARPDAQGLVVDMGGSTGQLSAVWQEWAVLSHACDPVGQPRMRPGRWRRWLERHALWVALTGLLSMAGTALFWLVRSWI